MKKMIIIILCVVSIGTLAYCIYYGKEDNSTANTSDDLIVNSNNITNITSEGEYTVTGESKEIVIDTTGNVVLTLDNVTINSDKAAIDVVNADSVIIKLVGDSYITTNFSGEDKTSSIYSLSNLAIEGEGSITINSSDDTIKGKKDVIINGGTFKLTAKGDGIHADGKLNIIDGTFDIDGEEGLEATYVKIDGGTINISATDDGINASDKSEDYSILFELNGGNITINMAEGDTDGVDSNGNIVINGGYISVNGESAFDYDGTATYNGGTIVVNGSITNAIPNQFMGGDPGQGGNPDQRMR